MELGKHLSFGKIFIGVYFLAFAVYLIIGLQPAEAVNYNIVGQLSIPEIDLTSDVTTTKIENNKPKTPNEIVGVYSDVENKTFLFGHSTTVFTNLGDVKIGDEIIYNGKVYNVTQSEILPKAEIDMSELLAETEQDTLIIMTCAGTLLDNGDATHRLIVTAI